MSGYRSEALPGRQRFRERLERWLLREVIPHPSRVTRACRWMRRFAPLLRAIPWPLELPNRERLRDPAPIPGEWPAHGKQRGTIAMLRGCVADRWFRDETLAAAWVLSLQGWRVTLPEPHCCGALHRHAGLLEEAHALSRRCAELLLKERPDYVVVDSAGCAAALAEPLEKTDPVCAELAARCRDTLGVLAEKGWTPPAQKISGDWVVAPPCHARHGKLGDDSTRQILSETLANGYSELPPPGHCCGAAGLYLLRRPALSRAIGETALERFQRSGASGVISGNPGCLLRWEFLLRGRRPPAEAAHPVMLLKRAYPP
ncbi:MAG: (Fe-S)-binding protein [Planctomycetota bacterium]